MKYTPGPWKASQSPGGWYRKRWAISSNIYSTLTITDGRDSIADVIGQTEEEALANARLIAAAPELVEACKKLIMHRHQGNLHAIDFHRIEQALTKTEGKETP